MLPFREEKCTASFEAVKWEELQPRGEVNQYSDADVSAEQPQRQPPSSTFTKTLHHYSFSMAAASHMIDEAWDLYGHSSQSIVDGDPGERF